MQQAAPQPAVPCSDAALINQEFYSHLSANHINRPMALRSATSFCASPSPSHRQVTGNRKEWCGCSANQQAHIGMAMNKASTVTSVTGSLQHHHQLEFFYE